MTPTQPPAALLAAAVATLTESRARTEALAQLETGRRTLGIRRADRLIPRGRVWRLGVLLLDAEARLFATGATTRAVPPGHPQFVSISAEVRKGMRAAAVAAGYQLGETVNFDARPLDPTSPQDPLIERDGELLVRWSSSQASLMPFAAYLNERVDLLAHPPDGA